MVEIWESLSICVRVSWSKLNTIIFLQKKKNLKSKYIVRYQKQQQKKPKWETREYYFDYLLIDRYKLILKFNSIKINKLKLFAQKKYC